MREISRVNSLIRDVLESRIRNDDVDRCIFQWKAVPRFDDVSLVESRIRDDNRIDIDTYYARDVAFQRSQSTAILHRIFAETAAAGAQIDHDCGGLGDRSHSRIELDRGVDPGEPSRSGFGKHVLMRRSGTAHRLFIQDDRSLTCA
jgi:hypothetical protein